MDFSLTEEQLMVRKMVRDFVDKEIIPYIKEWDEKCEFNQGILKRFGRIGFNGGLYPRKIRRERDGLQYAGHRL